MPRPISWLPHLHEIRRSVLNSVRSHYDRNDLERLFEVQPRSAQLLLELLPTVRLGRSLLVEREALASSLPSNVGVEPGRLEIRFNTLVELAESLHAVAQALDHDLDTCAQLWVPQATRDPLVV
jgi:hypothetical protein